MKKIVIILCVILIVSLGTANAESILLSGVLTKKSNYVYLLQSDKATYQLNINKNNKAIRDMNSAVKSKKQILLLAAPEQIMTGSNKGKQLTSKDGFQIMKVDFTVNPNDIGTEIVTFASVECGDSCYFNFINGKGKEQSYYATNFYGFSKLENDPSYKGKAPKNFHQGFCTQNRVYKE
jgi:hypothetical protein